MRWGMSRLSVLCLLFLSACGLTRCGTGPLDLPDAPDPVDQAQIDALYATPLPPPDAPLSVYFMGHSLIGRGLPAILAELAGDGHGYDSQLGWGAELQAHWGDETLDGAERENDHPRFREAHAAVDSGAYDALVMTEKVEITDSIQYHHSWYYMALWAEKAIAANPDIRLYFYETWPRRDIEDGWLARIDQDLSRYWEREIVDRALATDKLDRPVYIIPGGQVMARFLRAVEAQGGVGNVAGADDLFADQIHFNAKGAYLMALTHYAVLYQRSPVGLPYQLNKADGTPAQSLGPQAAALLQALVWEVVTGYAPTGVRG